VSWFGKLFGGAIGFMIGGPIGALIGATLGHNIDSAGDGASAAGLGPGVSDRERTQAAFFTATFGVMGHLAKADGRVSTDEIHLADHVARGLGLQGGMRQAARRLFTEGKRANFPLDEVLLQLRRECRRHRNLIRMFLEVQIQVAYADGVLHPAERRLLDHIAEVLGIPAAELRRMEAMIGAQAGGHDAQRSLQDAYAVLGVQPQAEDSEVKLAYRRLMSQHHPDKLVAKGLPEEMMQVATQKTQEIKAAYEQVKQARRQGGHRG